MEYNDLNDEQKATVDQRVESEYVNSDRDPLKELRAGAEAGTNPESHYYDDVSDDPEIAALQEQTQKVTQRGRSSAPRRPKAERWYLSPGQKPMGDPEQYRNIGGATPIEEQPEPMQGADGKWRTAFGGKVRVTDKDGNTSWEDTNGQAIEKPKSMQMMEAMNRGFSPNRGTATTWEDAIRQQQAERDNKSFSIAQQKADANNAALVSRKKSKIAQNLKTADNIGEASANLQKNLAEVQQHIKGGGGIEDSGAVMSKQGATKGNYYVFGIVAPSQMDDFNKSMAGLGVKDSMQKIVVSQQVDKYGNPVGEPIFAVQYMKGGNLGSGEGLYTKKLTLSEALNAVAKAHKADGRDPERLNDYLSGVFGDENAAKYGYKRGLSEKERIAQMRADASQNVAQINAQGRVDSAAVRAAGRGTAGAGAGAVKFDKDEFAAVKEMRAAYAPKIENEDGEMVDNPNADPEMFRRYSERMNQMLLRGAEGVPDGGGEGTQGGMSGVDAKRQELIRRGLLNPDGSPKQPVADNGGQQGGAGQQQGTTTQQSTQKRKEAPKESYDTKLTPGEESQYQEWRKTLPGPLQSEEDYDLRGYWKDPDTQKDGIKDGQHFTDRYKKPNHPTFSNESMYATGKNKSRAGHWDDNGDFVASEDQLSEREAARVKEFETLGGKYSSDSDGNVSLKIADWDYLPDDLKKHYPQTVRGDLDDDVIDVQRKAIAARKAFDEKFDKEILPGIEADAKRKFPNNEKKRNKYIDEQSIKWQHKNDPQYRREIEEISHKIWANTPIY